MGGSPVVRVALLGLAVALAGGWAFAEAALLVRALLRRGEPRDPPTRRARLRRAAGLSIGGLGLLCAVWGGWVEPRILTVTRETIPVPGLAAPLRLVHLTDLHCETTPGMEVRAAEAAAAEKPDLICLTGDYANAFLARPVFQATARRLAAIAPTFAVRGNWEAGLRADPTLFRGTDVVELSGTPVRFEARGASLVLCGLPWFREAEARDALVDAPRDAPRVFLYHTPDLAYEAAASGASLYLAGHTHGGQVRLPFYGALVTLSRFDKRFEMGRYEVGPMTLFVSRGVGLTGIKPRVRFLCPPEVAVLDLVPAPAAPVPAPDRSDR